jgi:hypothetical protein
MSVPPTRFSERLEMLSNFKHSCVFVFYRDLQRTNMQYKELFALLARHMRPNPWAIVDYQSLSSIPIQLVENDDDSRDQSVPSSLTIVPCQNSCIVCSRYPLDLQRIIADSGYIQSCGPLLYAAPWYDVSGSEFTNSILEYLIAKQPEKGRIVFYTMEDFGSHGKSQEGIDAIKFYKEKYFIGDKTVIEVMKELKDGASRQGAVVERFHREDKRDLAGFSSDFSVFTIRDYDVLSERSNGAGLSAEPQLIISYDSRYKKENPIHLLDEWKPFWPGQYTTPQPLVQSMLAQIPNPDCLIVDPFGGSGSVALAASSKGYKVFTSDLCGVEGIRFNWRFVRDRNLREKLLGEIAQLEHTLHGNALMDTRMMDAVQEISSVVKDTGWHWSGKLDDTLEGFSRGSDNPDLFTLLFHLVYRALSSNRQLVSPDGSFNTGRISLHLGDTLREFIHVVRRAFMIFQAPALTGSSDARRGRYGQLISGLSPEWGDVYLDSRSVASLSESEELRKLAQASERVAIITDPPYGVNTEVKDADSALVELYRQFVQQAIKTIALTKRREGDLIICALSQVKIGKRVPEAAYSISLQSVLHRELVASHCEVITHPSFRRLPPDLLRGGYWKSDKALDRDIISVTIRV